MARLTDLEVLGVKVLAGVIDVEYSNGSSQNVCPQAGGSKDSLLVGSSADISSVRYL